MEKICKKESNFQSAFKVSVIGCGNVGATGAFAMLIDSTPTELVLIDVDAERAEGLALDFVHSLSFLNYTKVISSSDYSTTAGSHLIFVTAGARQKDGETRLDLIKKNRAIFADMIPKLAQHSPEAILCIVTNPVDVLTYEALKLSGFKTNRVFGTGTMLDTARLRFHLGERLCMNPHSIDAFVLGEHGDSSFPVWSLASVAGKSIFDFPGFSKADADDCFSQTREAAYRIIHDMGFTCYSIATVMKEIMTHVFQHSRIVLPLSVVVDDFHGLSDVAFSVPCVLGSGGIEDIIEIPLNSEEIGQLKKSAKILKEYR